MSSSGGAPARLAVGQLIFWVLVFAGILALIVAFFLYGRQVQPLSGG